jgi:hypothetical protein
MTGRFIFFAGSTKAGANNQANQYTDMHIQWIKFAVIQEKQKTGICKDPGFHNRLAPFNYLAGVAAVVFLFTLAVISIEIALFSTFI